MILYHQILKDVPKTFHCDIVAAYLINSVEVIRQKPPGLSNEEYLALLRGAAMKYNDDCLLWATASERWKMGARRGGGTERNT